jgi:predicted metal-dependent hydrolase
MPEEQQLRIAGAPVSVRRHPRARRLRLRVDGAGELHLTVPPRTSMRTAHAFLEDQRAWAEQALRRMNASGLLGLDTPGTIPLLGSRQPVRYAEAERSSVRRGPVLVASGPTRTAAAAALERWARRELLRHAEAIVAVEAPRLGVPVPRLSVRAQRARWGSASARTRTLALNWRLLLAPVEALDYVVVHELCHFLEMSHAPRFWAFVEQTRPGYREPQRWLRTHQAEILRWSPLTALS